MRDKGQRTSGKGKKVGRKQWQEAVKNYQLSIKIKKINQQFSKSISQQFKTSLTTLK
jgi:hypothetical protein